MRKLLSALVFLSVLLYGCENRPVPEEMCPTLYVCDPAVEPPDMEICLCKDGRCLLYRDCFENDAGMCMCLY